MEQSRYTVNYLEKALLVELEKSVKRRDCALSKNFLV
jgi:hypothetical protein